MSAREAARVLRDVQGYEERLSLRADGVSTIVWGLAAAAIFLTYGTADPLLEDAGQAWLYAVLWVPWAVVGVVATAAIWNAHAVSLRRTPHTRRNMANTVMIALAFVGSGAVLFVALDVVGGIHWSVSAIMLLASGLASVGLGILKPRLFGGSRDGAMVVTGGMIAALAVLLGALGLSHAATTLAAAAAVGLGWLVSGLSRYRRG